MPFVTTITVNYCARICMNGSNVYFVSNCCAAICAEDASFLFAMHENVRKSTIKMEVGCVN